MKKNLFFCIIILAQLFGENKFTPRLNSFITNSNPRNIDHLIGIMVDFVEDNASETSGNGKFLHHENAGMDIDSYINSLTNYINYESKYKCSNETEFLLDKPPHDVDYFELQLEALKNYYTSINVDNTLDTDFEYHIVENSNDNLGVFHLDYPMQFYSTSDNQIGLLFADTIMKAKDDIESLATTENISDFENVLFVVFHAGLGQEAAPADGFDPTIYDIKSAYVDPSMLGSIPASGYDWVNDNLYGITGNFYGGIVMPETLNWLYYEDIEDIFPNNFFTYDELDNLYCDVQIGMTGLFAHLFGYHLGFRALNNTQTGQTRIGKFGLMDVGFYNWNGIVPSRPSAWIRTTSQMVQATDKTNEVINSGNQGLTFSVSEINESTERVYKIRISEDEYFLLENRSNLLSSSLSGLDHITGYNITSQDLSFECIIDYERDYVSHCPVSTADYSIENDDYRNIFDLIEKGYRNNFFFEVDKNDDPNLNYDYNVVTKVKDNYDRGLPGEGILIWHINEENYNANSNDFVGINNDINNKVVSLEEGDGVVNLGHPNYLIFDENDTGWRFDFWNDDNELYKDINYGENNWPTNAFVYFNDNSIPNSRTNDGINSFISIKVNPANVNIKIEHNYSYSILRVDETKDNIQVIGNDGEDCLFYKTNDNQEVWKYCDTVQNSPLTVQPTIINENTRIKMDESSIDVSTLDQYPSGYYDNLETKEEVIGALSLGDIDNDGYDEKIIINNGSIEVYNNSNNDILSNGFPVYGQFFGYPLVSDLLDHDGVPEIICKNGDKISFISNQGLILHEIPLYSSEADLYIIPQWNNSTSYALANGDILYIFDHDVNYNEDTAYWLNPFSTPSYDSEVGGPFPRISTSNMSEIGIDMSRAYNYPNPAKDDFTTFRFFVSKSSSVNIKIYDAAGYKVDEINNGSLVPNDYNEIRWNTSRLESGLYFAEIRSDRNESKLIKIVIL